MTSSHSFGKLKTKFDQVGQDNLACIAMEILLHYFTGLFFTSQNTKVHLVICTIHVFFSLWCFLLSFPFSLFIIWIKILFVLRNYFEIIEALTRVFFIINLFLTRLTAIQYCAWSWHLGSNLLRYSLLSWRLLIPLLFHF